MTMFDDAVLEVKGRGRLRLQPIDGSVATDVIEVEIDLHHASNALTLGDLKVAARSQASVGHHEAAHRLWSAVATMAERRRYPALIVAAKANAASARARLSEPERRSEPGKAKRYDYDEIARDVANGATRSEVAARYGCAMSTVARAVEYVGVRDELLDESPELFDQLMAGVDVAEVARRYGVSPKIVRWLVRTRYDRRDPS